jgi:hypothetical protein
VIERLVAHPRPIPRRTLPLVAAAGVIVLALPVFALVGWPVAGWALAAILWLAAQGLGLLLARLPLGAANLAASGVVGIGMMFRAVAVMFVLIAVAATDTRLGVSAALLYALAYTVELVLSLMTYFGSEATR